MDTKERQVLETAKRKTIIQVLMRCTRLITERAAASFVSSGGGPKFKPSHTTLLPHLDWDGVRITDIASRLGVTKQAVAPLVDDLEAMKIVERVPDPADGRAKLVRFRGITPVLEGLAHLERLEDELASVLGRKRLREFHQCLLDLLDHFDRNP